MNKLTNLLIESLNINNVKGHSNDINHSQKSIDVYNNDNIEKNLLENNNNKFDHILQEPKECNKQLKRNDTEHNLFFLTII